MKGLTLSNSDQVTQTCTYVVFWVRIHQILCWVRIPQMSWAQSSIPRLELCTTPLRGRHSSNLIQRRLIRYLTTTYTIASCGPRLKRMTMSSILSASCPLVDGYTSLTDSRLELFTSIESYSYHMHIYLSIQNLGWANWSWSCGTRLDWCSQVEICHNYNRKVSYSVYFLPYWLWKVNFRVSSFQTYHWSSNG